jgi:hypothetical protein
METTKHNDDKKEYFFFFGSEKITTGHSALTGAQIKALIPGFDQTHALVLEGHGDDPDQKIEDNITVDLNEHGKPKHFYSVPPATFG